jgi:hypothetical protein
MFESVVGERCAGCGDHLPADDLDGPFERLLADLDGVPEWLSDSTDEPMSDFLPAEWAINQSEPEFGTCEPSGWLALDLDSATADPHLLDDATLVEAMVGFDRLASWAAARQARLRAELAARRPSDRAPHSARWACIGSEYAPDEAGVALHLSRGTACARIGTACRLLAVLPETHAAWEAGRIDTSKARTVDDATWMLAPAFAWTTPTGHRHTTAPHDYRPDPPSPPGPAFGGHDATISTPIRPRSDDPDALLPRRRHSVLGVVRRREVCGMPTGGPSVGMRPDP